MRDETPQTNSERPATATARADYSADQAVSTTADMVMTRRSTALARPAYRFYRALLLTFARRGAAPDAASLQRLADEYGVPLNVTLDELATHDLVQRDPATGAIWAAYPFSGVPTAHRVRLEADGVEHPAVAVYAMCAIDALGIPFMLKRAAVVSSRDALTGAPVHVTLTLTPSGTEWTSRWEPEGAVVFSRPEEHQHEHGIGAAQTCCPIINFFATEATARQWASDHAPTDGRIFGQDEALRHAAAQFARALDLLDLHDE
jgi:hypothetical protein